MKGHILLTGATGAIGSMHLLDLLSRGYRVSCLVRCENEDHGRKRIADIVGSEIASQVGIVKGDITQKLGGIAPDELSILKGQFTHLVHHAGSIKFDQKFLVEIEKANVGGTINMLALAEALGIHRFCYDSTAYSLNAEPRNPYEKSKHQAETQVLDWQGGEVMVWRPSIVVGCSSDGWTNGFNGYYGFFSGFYYLKSRKLARLWSKNQDQCQEQGFQYDEEGNLVFLQPLFIDYSLKSTLNLVPVDWAVASMDDLMETATWGRAYNLVNENPPKVAWIIDTSFGILGIRGVRRLPEKTQPNSVGLQPIQEMINSQLERFWPYINHEMRFVCDAPQVKAPDINQEFLKTMLGFAMENRFSARKRKK